LYSASCILKKEKELRIKNGHPWVFRGDIAEYRGALEPSDIVQVCDSRGEFVALGYINPISKITVRILSRRQDEVIDKDFFYQRLKTALELREQLASNDTSYRLFFAESDGIPGLIIDRYNDYLVIQVLTLGIETRKQTIVSALIDMLTPKGIFEKSNAKSRELEGLQPQSQLLYGDFPLNKGGQGGCFPDVIEIQQDGLIFLVDVEQGQKTGFFLDQRENRRAFAKYVKAGDKVLDCFCYTGSFALIAAQKGAQAMGLDASSRAIEISKEVAKINKLEHACQFQEADVLPTLRELDKTEQQFDVIVLDPPAFAKDQKSIQGAMRGYKEINLRAMKLLKEGGFLLTCSCSQHIDESGFLNMLQVAAHDAQRRLKILEIRGQSWDHPIDVNFPESRYLKCVIAAVL
jgi:23S rRNA (cytosine1962-C5)-methyltransferase